ncbi:MAG: hypothetical protein GQE15_18045 [Archangiaceae bacterium]|nr:hypothetical protein [Archangiaceae bacterium]
MKRVPFSAFFVLAGLMLVQSASGFFVPSLYRDEQAWILAAWRGNDAVTAFVAVPALVFATWRARQGSTRWLLLALGLLWFCFYNDAYYLFGAALGVSFPLYVLLMLTCSVTLIVSFHRVDSTRIAATFGPRVPARVLGGALVLVGALLVVVWFAQWAAYVTTGKVVNLTPDAIRLIATMDTTVIAPTLIIGGALLWRRRPWGFVVAVLGGVLGGTYALVLTASTVVGLREGLPGMAEQLPLWVGLAAVLLAVTAVLLWNVDESASPQQT